MKKIISTILVACMLLTASVCLFSCGGDDKPEGNDNQTPEKVTYTITVVDQDGNPVKDVIINISTVGGAAFPMPTNAEGKVSYRTDKGISAMMIDVPTGYESTELNKEIMLVPNKNVTIVINKKAAADPYVILVVDDEGNPVAGVRVQMCDTAGSCRVPVTTDAEGRAEYAYEEGEFKVQITGGADGIPEGYTMDNPDQYFYFDGGKLITITLSKLG